MDETPQPSVKKKPIRGILYEYRKEFGTLLLFGITIIVMIPVFTYLYFIQDLRSKDTIMNRADTGVILLDRNDKPFFSFYEAKQRKFVPLSDIPLVVQEAVLASEDKDFYNHPGFSTRAIARSLYIDILTRNTSFGGSTITQQLVKNTFLTQQKSLFGNIRKWSSLRK